MHTRARARAPTHTQRQRDICVYIYICIYIYLNTHTIMRLWNNSSYLFHQQYTFTIPWTYYKWNDETPLVCLFLFLVFFWQVNDAYNIIAFYVRSFPCFIFPLFCPETFILRKYPTLILGERKTITNSIKHDRKHYWNFAFKYFPWQLHKTRYFLAFSRGVETEHWHKMG